MSSSKTRPVTRLCSYDMHSIRLRDLDLVEDVIGKMGFTELFFRQVMARVPTPAEVAILDAVLVTLMEHGLTPSAIATRMVAVSSPEATQAAIAAGLLGVGSQFIGTIENSAKLLQDLVGAPEGFDTRAEAVVRQHLAERRPLPGFGHHLHKPDDPRAQRLLDLAAEHGLDGQHVQGLKRLSSILDRLGGRHITINATGAVGALLNEIGIPAEVARGIAVVSRAAGLVAHVREEQQQPAARYLWDLAEREVDHGGTDSQ